MKLPPSFLRTLAIGVLVAIGCNAQPHAQQSLSCQQFSSNGRLKAGQSWRLQTRGGVEIGLLGEGGDAWALFVGAPDEKVNYLDVTPPLQFAREQFYIGRRYVGARDSVSFSRTLQFVTNAHDYETAAAAIAAYDKGALEAGAVLDTLNTLTIGRLNVTVTRFALSKTSSRGYGDEVLDWITFSGEVCVPRR